jgi:hypothetical protein
MAGCRLLRLPYSSVSEPAVITPLAGAYFYLHGIERDARGQEDL